MVADAARTLELDVVLDVELAVVVLVVAEVRCDADGCDVDRLAIAVLGAAALARFEAACRYADLRCSTGFDVVLDGAFCAARLPAARSASVIARFETRKRSV